MLSAGEEECAMVAQDRLSSDDLDDTTVTFGQQTSDKENFEKVCCESLFEQEVVQKKRYHTASQEEQQMKPHMLLGILEKILFAVNRACGMVKQMKNQHWGGGGGGGGGGGRGQLDERNNGQK